MWPRVPLLRQLVIVSWVFCVLPACSEADVVFIIDASGSLDEPNFDHIKYFVSNLTTQLDVDSGRVRVGVVTYSDRAEPRFNLSRYNNRYRRTLSRKR